MFKRDRHRAVLSILESLAAEKLAVRRFLFAGGTRIALDIDEFRESHDIDFMCSDGSSYADLRMTARSQAYAGLFTTHGLQRLAFPREIRVDQYGIRFPVICGEMPIKVELIREGRVEFEDGTNPDWSPVSCLSRVDCYVIKILANSDRWPDRQMLSRDLIDLAAMRVHWGPIPELAWHKAEAAYKSAARSDLRKALGCFMDDEEFQRRCFRGLSVDDSPAILRGLALLSEEI